MKVGVRSFVSSLVLGSVVVGVGACNAVIGAKDYVHASPDAAGTDDTPRVEHAERRGKKAASPERAVTSNQTA